MLIKKILSLTLAIEILVVYAAAATRGNETPRKRLTTADRILAHGYPAETHDLETSDGYILGLFRIPFSVKLHNQHQTRPIVLLEHGMTSSSDVYLSNGPDNGLPFLLVDAGYDVWLGNARGNIYSRRHVNFSVNTTEFWRFGWHEIAIVDVAATIDYILEQTGQKALHYVGHSQGTTLFLVLMSMRPEYNEKIKTSHLMAPVAYMGHTGDGMVTGPAPYLGMPGFMADQVKDHELQPASPHLQEMVNRICGSDGAEFPGYCKELGLLYTNGNYDNLNLTIGPFHTETHPSGASMNQLIHFSQEFVSNEFRQFDYGWQENMKRYGSRSPPNYPVENITSAVYLYFSDFDVSSNPKDVVRLASRLPNLKRYYQVPIGKWTHLDYLYGMDVKCQINDPIMNYMHEYERERRGSNEIEN